MIKVAPSLLAADASGMGEEIRKVLAGGADYLHYDVMDGHFVPNISFGPGTLAALTRAVPAVYDVHLMVTDPLRFVPAYLKAGAGFITFHLECDSPIRETIDAIHAGGAKAGLVIKPKTPAEALFPWLSQIEMVLVMSVEPGFGGQKFMPQALDKLSALRAEAKRQGLSGLLLEVDGGVGRETAAACVKSGATVLVAGSSVFHAADPAAEIAFLKNLQ